MDGQSQYTVQLCYKNMPGYEGIHRIHNKRERHLNMRGASSHDKDSVFGVKVKQGVCPICRSFLDKLLLCCSILTWNREEQFAMAAQPSRTIKRVLIQNAQQNAILTHSNMSLLKGYSMSHCVVL